MKIIGGSWDGDYRRGRGMMIRGGSWDGDYRNVLG